MDISVISIGNYKGIRLPKTLIEKYNITDTVELILEKGYIIIKPKQEPRDVGKILQKNAPKRRRQTYNRRCF